ncbi:MAG: RsiV family protein [Bacteroidia bacterium]|nr:RsiV family protein [Bacteroidia bacterium]
MKYCLLLLSVLFLVSCKSTVTQSGGDGQDQSSQSLPASAIQYLGTGQVGEYPINWELSLSGDQLSGRYRYEGKDAWLDLAGQTLPDQETFTFSESLDGKTTGSFNMYGGPRTVWSGFWRPEGKPDSLAVKLKLETALLFVSDSTWPAQGLALEFRTNGLYSPDSVCKVEYVYWRAPGKDNLSKAFNKLTLPPSLAIRGQRLNECLESVGQLGDLTDFPPSGEENTQMIHTMVGNVLVLNSDFYSYSAGAAHGNYGSSTRHILLPAFQELSFDDLFLPGYREALDAEVKKELSSRFPDEDGNAIEYKALPDDFNAELGAQHLTVYFNPYEIGPYALGQIRIPVRYAALADWIKPEGPLATVLTQR